MFLKYAAMACVLFCAPAAMACSLKTGVQPFVPQGTVSSDVSAGLKAPLVEVLSITRGIGARHSSCDDMGLVTLKLEWPRGTEYKLREIGFEFRVVSGEDSYQIFPAGPVSTKAESRDSEYLFMWRDGPPAEQRAVRLEVEVRAVTPDNRRGPATRVTISSAPGT